MSKREQLNKLLNEERIARTTVEQLCNEWEWTLSDKEATIVNNQIVINKGKIVKVPVVKETVIDNTDSATIEKLNARIKELEEDNDKLYKLYLEEQREKEVWAAAHADLKDEYSALRNSHGELEEAYDVLADNMANRNNRIEDLKIQIENLKAQNNSLEEELMEAESQNMILEGKVIGYEMDIERLKAKTNKPSIVIDDEEFDEEPEEKPVVKETKATTSSHEAVDITLYDVKKTHDGVRGRTDNYEFAWAIGKNIPAYKLNGEKAWKPMTGKLYTEAKYIMSTLRNFMEQVKTEVEAKDKKKNNKPERTTKIHKEEPKQNEQVKKEVNTKEEKQDNRPERTTKIRKEEKQDKQKNTVNTKEKNIYKANDKEVDPLGNTDEMEFC